MIKKVAIVRTAGPIQDKVYQDVGHFLQQLFTQVEFIFEDEHCRQMTPEARAEKLLTYATDPSIDLLWSIRGGEGSADLIPYIEPHVKTLKKLPPKYLMGISDFTPILLYFQQRLDWKSIHGPAAAQIIKDRLHQASLQQLQTWFNNPNAYGSISLQPINLAAQHATKITGYLRGGNLSLCNISIQDQWEIDPNGAILFFEDWHEKGHVVNRTLKYFKRIGMFDNSTALILGDFSAGPFSDHDDEHQKHVEYLLGVTGHFAEQLSIPAYRSNDFGHGLNNLPIPMYCPMEILSTADQVTLNAKVQLPQS